MANAMYWLDIIWNQTKNLSQNKKRSSLTLAQLLNANKGFVIWRQYLLSGEFLSWEKET